MSQGFDVEIRLFAQAAQLAGTPRVTLQLEFDGSDRNLPTVRDIANYLCSQYPQLIELIERSRWAIENEFATKEQRIKAGQSIALIPPVSGG